MPSLVRNRRDVNGGGAHPLRSTPRTPIDAQAPAVFPLEGNNRWGRPGPCCTLVRGSDLDNGATHMLFCVPLAVYRQSSAREFAEDLQPKITPIAPQSVFRLCVSHPMGTRVSVRAGWRKGTGREVQGSTETSYDAPRRIPSLSR
jgi:hypothetical protein